MNCTVEGSQCTISWNVDDLKIFYQHESIVSKVVNKLEREFRKFSLLNVAHGKCFNYLGMLLYYEAKNKVLVSREYYVTDIISLLLCSVDRVPVTPATGHIITVGEYADKLSVTNNENFHHLTLKILYISRRARPDILVLVYFLITRVNEPDYDKWKKLDYWYNYSNSPKKFWLTFEADNINIVKWYIKSSHAVYPDMRHHTGGRIALEKGSIYN